MNKAMASSSEIHDILNQDEEFKIEYDRLKPRYDLIAQIINARHEQKITQAEMAKRMGTNKSNISRFEESVKVFL